MELAQPKQASRSGSLSDHCAVFTGCLHSLDMLMEFKRQISDSSTTWTYSFAKCVKGVVLQKRRRTQFMHTING